MPLKMAVAALAVATQEAMDKDSMSNDTASFLQSLSLSVRLASSPTATAWRTRLSSFAGRADARAVSKRDLSSPLGNRAFPALVPPCGEA